MQHNMAALVKGLGKQGKGEEDSDDEGTSKISIVKPKMRLTQREGSRFLKRLNYDVSSQEEMMELLMQ